MKTVVIDAKDCCAGCNYPLGTSWVEEDGKKYHTFTPCKEMRAEIEAKDLTITRLKETLGKFVKREPGEEGAHAETPTSMEEIREAFMVLVSAPEINTKHYEARGMRLLMKDKLLSNFAIDRIEHLANKHEGKK